MASTFESHAYARRARSLLRTQKWHLAALMFCICGGGEIRTHGPRKWTTVFKTVALNHSATPPNYLILRTVQILNLGIIHKAIACYYKNLHSATPP